MTDYTDYKDTLNLPHTDFAMKANLVTREPLILAKWQQENIYEQLRVDRKNAPRFVLHDGPPYANGQIHIGHAVNKILKDFIVKAKSLNGMDAPYVPGWDCHGLPIELQVEKKIGKAGNKVSTKQFRQACRDYAQKQIEAQRTDFIRLGVIADWQHPYKTMDYDFEGNIIRALADIYANGYVVQGYKPVHWCMDCASALAEAEVEYAPKKSPSIYVKFLVKNPEQFLEKFIFDDAHNIGHGAISVVIWTTTPWTLPANQAVALHPQLEYVLVQYNNERLVIATDRLLALQSELNLEFNILGRVLGEELIYTHLQNPLYDRESLLIMGDHVTIDAGTGCVHTAPAHGVDDFNMGIKYGLSLEHAVNDRGVFIENQPLVGGLFVFDANAKIIEFLEEHKLLLAFSQIEHSYPHCWRHKKPIIFRATPQWFISMEHNNLREQALAAIDGVQWIPQWGYTRMQAMVNNSPDWCISRQRVWCVPLPIFIHRDTQLPHPQTSELMRQVADLVTEHGIDAWHELDPAVLLSAEDIKNYIKISDGLDVWFDSGVTHAAVLQSRADLAYPADLYLEGSDQHRGWFQSSLKTALAQTGIAPYKAILTHGFTVDSQGRKMSKSIGNTIEPQAVINKYGADILRLWVASTDYRGEITVSDENFQRIAEGYRRIRNTCRFLLANINDFIPSEHLVAADQLVAIDAWIIQQVKSLQENICAAYDAYQFHTIYQYLLSFCSIELGSFYLDVIKDRQYTTAKNSRARRSAQTAMYYVLEVLVRAMQPILTFTAEELWQVLPDRDQASVLLAKWFTKLPEIALDSALDWQLLIEVRTAVNKILEQKRNEKIIGSGLEAKVTLYATQSIYDRLIAFKDELRFILITSKAETILVDTVIDYGILTNISGLAVVVDVMDAQKCVRCWHRCADIGSVSDHPTLCVRCVTNITGEGEERIYA